MAVNRWVAGSNPARGAKFLKDLAGDLPTIKPHNVRYVYGLRGQRKAWRVKGRASVTRAAAAADSYSRTVPLVTKRRGPHTAAKWEIPRDV